MWLYFRDLNDTLAMQDKVGGTARNPSRFSFVRQVVSDCAFIDLGFEGHPFTWTNGRQGEENIQCRLDRAFGNEEFCNGFSPIKVLHLPRFGSDHAAVLIHLEAPQQSEKMRRKKLFRFEESWCSDGRCEDIIRHCWTSQNRSCRSKLDGIQVIGKEFEEHNLGNIKKEIIRLERILKDNSMWSDSVEDSKRYKKMEIHHAELLKTEEII